MFVDGDMSLTNATAPTLTAPIHLPGLNRVRSNSAPPYPDTALEDVRVPSPATGQHCTSAHSSGTSRKPCSALTLRPLSLEGEEKGCEYSMWLGTEGGQVYIYQAGDNLRCRSNRRTVDLGSAVHCIR